jgi:hypothetical protein
MTRVEVAKGAFIVWFWSHFRRRWESPLLAIAANPIAMFDWLRRLVRVPERKAPDARPP